MIAVRRSLILRERIHVGKKRALGLVSNIMERFYYEVIFASLLSSNLALIYPSLVHRILRCGCLIHTHTGIYIQMHITILISLNITVDTTQLSVVLFRCMSPLHRIFKDMSPVYRLLYSSSLFPLKSNNQKPCTATLYLLSYNKLRRLSNRLELVTPNNRRY